MKIASGPRAQMKIYAYPGTRFNTANRYGMNLRCSSGKKSNAGKIQTKNDNDERAVLGTGTNTIFGHLPKLMMIYLALLSDPQRKFRGVSTKERHNNFSFFFVPFFPALFFLFHSIEKDAHNTRTRTPTRPRKMGNKQSAVELPDEPPAPEGGREAVPRSPTGGALFKFENGTYNVLTSAVVPELSNDGDDDAPQWILDVSDAVVNDPREGAEAGGDSL